MRKFFSTLVQSKIPEWEPFYINLEKIISLSSPLKTKKNETTITALNLKIDILENKLIENIHESNKDFLPILEHLKDFIIAELNKVYLFCTENIVYYEKRIHKIADQLKLIRTSPLKDYLKEKDQLEQAIKELYKEVNFMTGFIDINYNCEKLVINKIKGYCEVLFSPKDYKSFFDIISNFSLDLLMSNTKKAEILNEINRIFMINYFDKYKLDTKSVLSKSVTSNSGLSITQTFLLGLFVGCTSVIVIISIIIASKYGIDMDDDIEFNIIFPMFRGQIILCMFMWLFSFDVYLWTVTGVNYKKIFQFSNHFSDFVTLLKRAAFFTFIVLFMIFYYIMIRTKVAEAFNYFNIIPLKMTPLVSWLIMLCYLFFPVEGFFNYKGRAWFLKHVWESITNISIEFAAMVIIANFCSLIGVFRDFAYTVCYYYHYNHEFVDGKRTCDPISFEMCMISLIPPILIAFLQLLKWSYVNGTFFTQSINFLRYFFSIITIAMAFSIKNDPNYKYIWLISSIWTAVHGFYWDITLDWGLLQTTSTNFMLRDKLAIKNKAFYYIAMLCDFFLRFLWVLIISPDVVYQFIRPEFVFMILYTGEAFRRSIYNYISIEFEHISYCSSFRATQFIETPFYMDENGQWKVKDFEYKKVKAKSDDSDYLEKDKITSRLNKILMDSFFNRDRWIKNKDFIKRIYMDSNNSNNKSKFHNSFKENNNKKIDNLGKIVEIDNEDNQENQHKNKINNYLSTKNVKPCDFFNDQFKFPNSNIINNNLNNDMRRNTNRHSFNSLNSDGTVEDSRDSAIDKCDKWRLTQYNFFNNNK
jgi:hypothetical protein